MWRTSPEFFQLFTIEHLFLFFYIYESNLTQIYVIFSYLSPQKNILSSMIVCNET